MIPLCDRPSARLKKSVCFVESQTIWLTNSKCSCSKEVSRWLRNQNCHHGKILTFLVYDDYFPQLAFSYFFAFLIVIVISELYRKTVFLPQFCLWNPGSWGFGIRNSGQGIRNPANDRDPEFKFHKQGIWNPVPGIRSPERLIHNPKLSWITSLIMTMGRIF